jgi:hypothetical protein
METFAKAMFQNGLDSLSSDADEDGASDIIGGKPRITQLLRVIRYGIRGGASMLDFTAEF